MAKYEEYITNDLTGETVLIKSNDIITFEEKKYKKLEAWGHKNNILLSNHSANEATEKAINEINAYKNLLSDTLHVNDVINWKELESSTPYREYKPLDPLSWSKYEKEIPKRNFFLNLIPYFKQKSDLLEKEVKNKFEKDKENHIQEEKKRKLQYENDKAKYLDEQLKFNKGLEEVRIKYESNAKEGNVNYFNLVLERSKYPESLNLNYELYSDENTRLLLVEIDMPNTKVMPNIIEYKYVASKNEIISKEMKQKDFELFYNNTLFQIVLRTAHEVFESDYNSNLDIVVINGWVEGIDVKTGKSFRNCVMSLQTSKDAFVDINLSAIDPKECFKHLKGVTAGSLVQLSPVKPILSLDTYDNRIIQTDNVLQGLDINTNLASMEWQEFEILVRDLIAKEFSREGCKVEVTRASRDAGVDAIAFDTDPIRGGKYVIQAKRYNNLVPLTAVRDLYGTVHNEGAVKGILITTSYYGKDSLEFAKDKPLTLINGEELLYMFNKYGYNFKIELKEKKSASSNMH